MALGESAVSPEVITSWTYENVVTNRGAPFVIEVKSGKAGLVAKLFARYIVDVNITPAYRTNVEHGCFGQYTRYDIVKHEYAASMVSYVELIEIRDAPEGRNPIVIHYHGSDEGDFFMEWEDLESAQTAFKSRLGFQIYNLGSHPGHVRTIRLGALQPWFYAVGDQELVGDYAVPLGVQDDPEFRLGEQYVVFEDGLPRAAVCLGTRFIAKHYQEHRSSWSFRRDETVETFRLVHFSDGYIWDERKASEKTPRPMKAEEAWIAEVVAQFRACLAGERTDVNIQFTDGTAFTGCVKGSRITKHSKAGDYEVRAMISRDGKPAELKEGWFNGFVPSVEHPDVISFAKAEALKKGSEIKTIEIIGFKPPDGKRRAWSGVFYSH
ncbi:MAG: hypothetical protein AAGA35_01885 [Patescibacteria group bacterium]